MCFREFQLKFPELGDFWGKCEKIDITVGIAFSDYSRIQKSQLAAVDLLRIYSQNVKKSVRI